MARISPSVSALPTSPARAHPPLPALGLPGGREDRRAGAVVSVLMHLLVIFLLVAPVAAGHEIVERPQGAGGPGPVGGGGGGHGGTGGQTKERLRFVRLTPPPPAAIPVAQPVAQPTIQPPKPVVKPPEPVKQPPVVDAPKPTVTPAQATTKPLDVAATPGTGGGSGKDGTNGTGPGTGGGVGSGVGPGRGSGVGPGTGGGNQANYPPAPTEIFLPPMPIPGSVRGFHLVAEFDVDEMGRVLSFEFTPTRDGSYNRRLQEVFRSFRFRPGTKPDGTPIRMKAQVAVDLF